MRAHENPFRLSRVDSLRFRGEQVPALAATLRLRGYRGAVVGPEGSGKSTLLREIAEHLEHDGQRVRIVRFDDLAALVTALVDRGAVWLIDGAERIPLPLRAVLTASLRSVVITTHTPATGLPLLVRCATTPALLTDLLGDLHGPTLSAAEVEGLFYASRGNLRLAFRSLYDMSAQDFVGAFLAR
jgi:energy-coupling factor transporter ATP-binding protein EcfA2